MATSEHKQDTELIFNGNLFKLHNHKALFWPEKNALLLSDIHLGKLSHFRSNGINIPTHGELDNLMRLQELILLYDPTDIYILGDLFHSKKNETWSDLKVFIEAFRPIRFTLIAGNHDILDKSIYYEAGLNLVSNELNCSGIHLIHDHKHLPDDIWSISGHIHPGVILKGPGKQRVKMPCFWVTDKKLILPAFGLFTGLFMVKVKTEDRVFVILDQSVKEVF